MFCAVTYLEGPERTELHPGSLPPGWERKSGGLTKSYLTSELGLVFLRSKYETECAVTIILDPQVIRHNLLFL
jgi:hypothetical protein